MRNTPAEYAARTANSLHEGQLAESRRARYARTTQDIGFHATSPWKRAGIRSSLIMIGVVQNHSVITTVNTWPVSRRYTWRLDAIQPTPTPSNPTNTI